MKRLALVALLAAGCGEITQLEPGPLGEFTFPTGVAVAEGRLIVASSNFDLRYDHETGGSLISVDPDAIAVAGAINIRSFAGDVAVADRVACGIPETLALVPVRGSNFLYPVTIGADGSPSCDGCEISLAGTAFVDPFAAGVACGGGVARAYVGYMRSSGGFAWITQVDLSDPSALQHRQFGTGRVRDFAYEADRSRLWIVGGSGGIGSPLRWVDLAGDCRFDGDPAEEDCPSRLARSTTLPSGLELRSISLSNAAASPRRAYLTARRYDPAVANLLGLSAPDLGGVLLVADLVDDLTGDVELRVVRSFDIGLGAGKVRVLPARAGRPDVVVALAADDGVLWVYDDESGDRVALGRDPTTGAPAVGHQPFGLAVDPATHSVPSVTGPVARVYVGSFQDGDVTPVDVPLDEPWSIQPPSALPSIGPRIEGGTP